MSRTLIFSDTHFTDQFDSGRFALLKQAIIAADAVIINGDFWDRYLVSFSDFLASPWQQLFPLLKAKKAIYLYGNHDRPEYCDERMSQFSTEQGEEYWLKTVGGTYYVTHGNQISPAPDQKYKLPDKKIFTGRFKKLTKSINLVEKLSVIMFGKPTVSFGGYHNPKMKRWAKHHLPADVTMICGHSHRVEANARRKFYNSGYINYGIAHYLWVDDLGVELVQRQYR
jgi:predicted phosphodiesterase